jgi:DNA-binding transcriptional LysR family regulator
VLYHPDHGLAGVLAEVCRRAGFSPRGTVRTSQAEGAARLAAAGIGPALVPDNIVLPGIEGTVLHLDPPLIRDVAVYARTELSRTAAAFVEVLQSEQRRRPRGATTIHL